MFIVWGKKHVYRKLGYVAHFCPLCRGPQPFELKRVGLASHVYYASFGEGELVGYERTCMACGTALQADPEHHSAIARRMAPLSELIRDTFPAFEQVFSERLALEEQVRRNPRALSPEDRRALIRSPFLLMSAKAEQRFAKTHIDAGMGLALAGTVALAIFAPMLVEKLDPTVHLGNLILGCVAVGIAAIVWQTVASRPRYVRRAITPVLARSLRPLKPTQAELESVVAEMAGLRHKLAKRIDVPALHAQTEAPAPA